MTLHNKTGNVYRLDATGGFAGKFNKVFMLSRKVAVKIVRYE
jgi:isopentenyl phosphate kinase